MRHVQSDSESDVVVGGLDELAWSTIRSGLEFFIASETLSKERISVTVEERKYLSDDLDHLCIVVKSNSSGADSSEEVLSGDRVEVCNTVDVSDNVVGRSNLRRVLESDSWILKDMVSTIAVLHVQRGNLRVSSVSSHILITEAA